MDQRAKSSRTTQVYRRQPVRAAVGALIGTTIEAYDFYSYGTAAALVFGEVFFRADDPYIGIAASLLTFAIGFLARPFGALIFGHLGDKVGRKRALVVTLIIMGAATVLIGLLPTYASIGPAAPILLVGLRLAQGIAVGGEWGGAVLIATEHAPPKWKTFLAAAPQYGSPVGLILASLAFQSLSGLSRQEFLDWGWRVPFLISGLLIVTAYLVRSGIRESPEFEAHLQTTRTRDAAPAREIFRSRKATLAMAMGVCLLGIAGFYFLTTLMTTFATTSLGIDRSVMLKTTSWVGVVEIIAFPIGSWIATKTSERSLLVMSSTAALLFAIPMMKMIVSGNETNILLAVLIGTVFVATHYAVMAPFLTRAYPVHLRYTGVSLSASLSAAVFSGLIPLVGVWLVKTYGVQWFPLAALFIGIAAVTLVCSIFLPIDEADS
jgi:MFS family permease